jgi:hypothetical protein
VPALIVDFIDSLAAFFNSLASAEESDDLSFESFSMHCFSGLRDVGHVRSDLSRCCLYVKPFFPIQLIFDLNVVLSALQDSFVDDLFVLTFGEMICAKNDADLLCTKDKL